MRYSKLIVALVIVLNAAFAAGALVVFFKVGSEPTALIAAWFGFTTGELWMLSGIKKRDQENKNNVNGVNSVNSVNSDIKEDETNG